MEENLKLLNSVLETLSLQEKAHIGIIWDVNSFYTEESGYSLENAKKGFNEEELIEYYVNLSK